MLREIVVSLYHMFDPLQEGEEDTVPYKKKVQVICIWAAAIGFFSYVLAAAT